MNIFLFWIGNDEYKNKLIRSLQEKIPGANIEVGPSNDEHNHLLEVSKYYRESYSNGIYSFCSDVWRFMKLSMKKGLYIDTSTIIGENIKNFYSRHISAEATLFRGNCYTVETGVMFSGVNNNDLFKKIFDYYKGDLDYRTHFFAPTLLTKFLTEYHKLPATFDDYTDGFVSVKSLLNIRDLNSIWKTSTGSWTNKKTVSTTDLKRVDRWAKWEKNFVEKKYDKRWKSRYERHVIGSAEIDVHILRMFYDKFSKINDSKQLRLLNDEYKKITYKVTFSERLIWSKFSRFFSLNWLKIK